MLRFVVGVNSEKSDIELIDTNNNTLLYLNFIGVLYLYYDNVILELKMKRKG